MKLIKFNMIPNRMILAETNVISIYGKPIFNNREPNIAPIKLAKLNTEAANVLANNGASCAFKIIILLSNGVVPNVPKPNIKQMINANTVTCNTVTNSTIVINNNKNV